MGQGVDCFLSPMPKGCSSFCNREVNFFILILITPKFYGCLYYRSGGRPWYKSDPNYDPIWDYVAEYHTDDYDEALLLLVLKNGARLWMPIIFSAFGSLGLRLFELLRWV